MRSIYDLSELRAVIDGKHFLVRDKSSGSPVRLYYLGQQALMLAPDGRSVITALAVDPVPQEWETLYRPSNPTDAVHRIAAGHQNLDAFAGYNYVSEYVLIDLTSGKVSQLTDAPIGFAAGWSSFPSHPDWSRDGRAVVLSNTFVRANPQGLGGQQNPPCIAVVELLENRVNCVERLHGETNTNDGHEIAHHVVRDARFVRGDNQRVRIDYWAADASEGSITYGQSSDGSWTALDKANGWPTQNALIALNVKESFTDPPVLIATDKGTNTSRAIFDPNPQLRDIDLGEASVFTWKDKHDRDWNGGLYKPPGYVSGRRYPLVIQTHGFTQFKFVPSGVFPTAFAARELASAGILVLQVPDCPILNTPEEGSCNVAVYEAAVEQLVAAGLVDPERVGIIGFSRSCYYVLEALTNSTLHLKAASITDGINVGYMEYMMGVDYVGNLMAHTADAIIGAPPFREGLQRWLKRSPDLNMDKVVTPLLVVENGFAKVIQMWEPYAALRYLNRPVDLILLNSDEHILTNPGVRMASQGGTVDWFRFWLNGEEDSDPKKAEQYVRWRELRKLQAENDVKEKAAKETTPVN